MRACVCLSVCLCVCLSVCLSLASDSSETVEVIIIKLGMMASSNIVMHHVFIILTLTFILDRMHTALNHENHTCSIISEDIQAIRIRFATKIVRLKVYNIIFSQSDDLALTQYHKCAVDWALSNNYLSTTNASQT